MVCFIRRWGGVNNPVPASPRWPNILHDSLSKTGIQLKPDRVKIELELFIDSNTPYGGKHSPISIKEDSSLECGMSGREASESRGRTLHIG
jgi:hypothetical protein